MTYIKAFAFGVYCTLLVGALSFVLLLAIMSPVAI